MSTMSRNFDILKNKTNSQNVSSAKKNEENNSLAKIGGKAKSWHDGLRSESGYQRMQTMAEIVATIMAGGG